jgi:PAS domain S-box-containing protein
MPTVSARERSCFFLTVIIDDCHRILFVSSGFVEMIGMTREDVIGTVVSQFYSAKEWEFVLEQTGIASRFGRNRYGSVLPRNEGGRLPRRSHFLLG